MLTSILAAALVLGVLILIHECGHFFAARRVGVRVLKFSLGFGPRLFGFRRGDTEYVVSAIPFGGFVKMVGEDPDDRVPAAYEKVSFSHQSIRGRAAIVLAGPATNIIGAFVLFAIVFAAYGVRTPSDRPLVGGLTEGMPAAAAGLLVGDVVQTIDAGPVATWDELSQAIRGSGGRALVLGVDRQGRRLEIPVAPKEVVDKSLFGEDLGTRSYVIGIERGMDVQDVGPVTAVLMAAQQTWGWTETIFVGLYKMVTGSIPARDIGGPLEIARQAGRQANQGVEFLLMYMAIISLNLGLLNLFPIPILDGGHLLFLALEAAMRRPLDIRHRELAQQAGLFLLLALMVFAFYNDIVRVLHGIG